MTVDLDIAKRAVRLIKPEPARLVECYNAVVVALHDIDGTDKDVRRLFQQRDRDARRVRISLCKVIEKMQKTLTDPRLPVELRSIRPPPAAKVGFHYIDAAAETERWLALWAGRLRATPRGLGFTVKAARKRIAAEEAHGLLLQFKRDITSSPGGLFCRLAAMLHGTPKADFHRTCAGVIRHPQYG